MDKDTTPTPSMPPGAKYRGAVVEVSFFTLPIGKARKTRADGNRIYNSRLRFVWTRMLHYNMPLKLPTSENLIIYRESANTALVAVSRN